MLSLNKIYYANTLKYYEFLGKPPRKTHIKLLICSLRRQWWLLAPTWHLLAPLQPPVSRVSFESFQTEASGQASPPPCFLWRKNIKICGTPEGDSAFEGNVANSAPCLAGFALSVFIFSPLFIRRLWCFYVFLFCSFFRAFASLRNKQQCSRHLNTGRARSSQDEMRSLAQGWLSVHFLGLSCCPDSFNCRCCFNSSRRLHPAAFRQRCLLFNEANQQIVMMPKSFSALLAFLHRHPFTDKILLCFYFFVPNDRPETHLDQEEWLSWVIRLWDTRYLQQVLSFYDLHNLGRGVRCPFSSKLT